MELRGRIPVLLVAALVAACSESGGRQSTVAGQVESCMLCHNGSKGTNYAGPGIENPHPFPGAENLSCTVCHGGNPDGEDKDESHVPPPPEIGDREQQRTDRRAYFNRLTLTGIDKFPDYVVDGTTWTALDYLQFVNPGDLRVVTQGRSCGLCHAGHAATVSRSLLATEAGILSGASYFIGVDNAVPGSQGLYEDTAADMGFRAVAGGTTASGDTGAVAELIEYPVYSVRGRSGPMDIQNNPAYDAVNLPASLGLDNKAVTGSPLANLVHEQIAFTCGDCHLGSAGANNRYGDFRSSGCTSCHMPYSLDGRSRSRDPNVPKDEPLDPDDIDEPERAHVRAHRIRSVAKTLESGVVVDGIDDYTCAGCHQGSNRTVMQYWGIRLDQNQDLRNRVQYPANPVTWRNTSNDTRLFDPQVRNRTFNGRNANQYILLEDYDGDGRDDTPPDVHYEAGMGCIDCHGSEDLHGGDTQGPTRIASRMEEAVGIRCESCHGGVEAYAATKPGIAHDGTTADLAVDAKGNVLPHVVKEADGNFYLYGRLTGRRHFVSQTRDVTVDTGRVHPFTQQPVYSSKASFAMGRDDGLADTGTGPGQGGAPTGFRHGDTMNCASCHASWTNTCMGCHLEGEYDNGNNFSNITGERIVFKEDNADFVYQSPVYFQLGVNSKNEIAQVSSNTKMFFQWEDRNNIRSERFAFTDRNGGGANPARAFPSLGHNAMLAHSIRGKVSDTNEGPRYCVACHMTRTGLEQYGTLYDQFRANMAANAFDQLDFGVLRDHFGRNPGNQMNSPLWVHMVAGLGTGLFLFDDQGYPNNPLDTNVNRKGRNDDERVAPATLWDPARTAFNLDRIVDEEGIPTGSSNHAMLQPGVGPQLRDNAPNPNMAGPLGRSLIRRLTDPVTGIVLDTWLDADGNLQTAPPPAPPPPPAPQTAR